MKNRHKRIKHLLKYHEVEKVGIIKPFTTAIIILLIGGLLVSCSNSQASAIEKEKLSLGISQSFLSIPIYLAREKGFFAEEGLDITIIEYSSGKLATQAMLSGEVNVSTAADMPIVYNAFNQKDFYILATFTSSYNFTTLLARKDLGIEKAADLKNKKIGVNQKTSSHFYLGAFLADNLIPISDIKIVQKETVDLADALINEEVAAISIWQPYGEKAKNVLGNKVVQLSEKEIYRATFSLVVKRDFPQAHKSALKKLLIALNKAAQFSKNNKEESIDIIARIFDLERGIIASSWDGYKFGTYLDQALLVGLDDIAMWAIESKIVDQQQMPNFLDFIYPDILSSVFPQGVTIIR